MDPTPVSPLVWSIPHGPDATSLYDHVTAPGRENESYLIEWKSWKEAPNHDLYLKIESVPDCDKIKHLGTHGSLDEAMAHAHAHYRVGNLSTAAIVAPSKMIPTHPHVPIKISLIHGNARVPTYATPLSSGFDLMACVKFHGDRVIIPPGETMLINTGIQLEIPPGYEVQIRSRSGLALKHGIVVLNSPGTIDADYRGPIGVILKNTSRFDAFEVSQGMKIAQGVVCPIVQALFVEVLSKDLTTSERGTGGFGSTGL